MTRQFQWLKYNNKRLCETTGKQFKKLRCLEYLYLVIYLVNSLLYTQYGELYSKVLWHSIHNLIGRDYFIRLLGWRETSVFENSRISGSAWDWEMFFLIAFCQMLIPYFQARFRQFITNLICIFVKLVFIPNVIYWLWKGNSIFVYNVKVLSEWFLDQIWYALNARAS